VSIICTSHLKSASRPDHTTNRFTFALELASVATSLLLRLTLFTSDTPLAPTMTVFIASL